jgi:hypothetical protein
MTEALNETTFTSWAARLRRLAGRFEGLPGEETTAARYCELLGNVYWHFSREDAAPWFRRAIDLQKSGAAPSWRTAVLYWKAGDESDFHTECKNVIAASAKVLQTMTQLPVPADTFAAREHERNILRSADALAIAYLLLEAFDDAIRTVSVGEEQSAKWASWDKTWTNKPSSARVFIRDISHGILQNDQTQMQTALDSLRGHLLMWPTDAGGMAEDLYRFGLHLRDKHFPTSSPRLE